MEQWKHDWQEDDKACAAHHHPLVQTSHQELISLAEWVTLNRLRTGVGRFGANMYHWGLRPSTACLCGAPEQTADHILSECTRLGPHLGSPTDLTNPCPETVDWLQQLREVV